MALDASGLTELKDLLNRTGGGVDEQGILTWANEQLTGDNYKASIARVKVLVDLIETA